MEFQGRGQMLAHARLRAPVGKREGANVSRCVNVQVYQPNTSDSTGDRPALVLLGESEGYRAPSQYILYVDNSAEHVAPEMASFLQAVYGVDPQVSQRVTINKASSKHARRLEIPGILSYQIEASGVRLSESVRDHLYAWLFKPEQWRVRSVGYRAPGVKFVEYEGTNSLIAEFRLTSENLQVSQTSTNILLVRPRQGSSIRRIQRTHPPFRAACGNRGLSGKPRS